MPRQTLDKDSCWEVLESQSLLRVAFNDGPTPYVVPLGYRCLNRTLYGAADSGRKTELAKKNKLVSFQVDTAVDTGLWEWRSVMGAGDFVVIGDEEEKRGALAALQKVISQAPQWWRTEQAPRMAAGTVLIWKIEPSVITGCEYVPPADL